MNCPDGLDTCVCSVFAALIPTTLPPPDTFCVLRFALYGGGAGVAAGFAVLGGGNGGNDAFDVRKNGLPYVARYLKSIFRPFCSNGC